VSAAQGRLDELTKYREDEINQAKAELDDTKAQRDQLFVAYQRSISLRETRALSAQEYEQAESAYKSMDQRMRRLQLAYDLIRKGPRDERIAAAKGELAQYQAELVKAKWKLDNTTITAPIDGTILSKKAEEGNYVNPSAFSNGLSASVCEMADLANMEVDLSIAERDIAKVVKGQVCKVRAEAFPDRPYPGVVSRIMPQADRAKGSVPVRVKIDIPRQEAGQFLRPDMGALVTFYNDKR
jgi:HlyD family secretion protein